MGSRKQPGRTGKPPVEKTTLPRPWFRDGAVAAGPGRSQPEKVRVTAFLPFLAVRTISTGPPPLPARTLTRMFRNVPG